MMPMKMLLARYVINISLPNKNDESFWVNTQKVSEMVTISSHIPFWQRYGHKNTVMIRNITTIDHFETSASWSDMRPLC